MALAMAIAAPCAHQIAPAQCDLLVHAASRGDVMAVTAVLDADPLGYLKRDQMRALLRACDVTGPHQVAVLDLFHARRNTLFRQSYHIDLDIALKHAKFDAERFLNECSAPELERHLLLATTTRNVPLVLCAAIKTNAQPLVLRLMGLSAVQAFLASLEASFEPCFVMPDHQPHEWLAQAMARNMDAVVAMAAERCPLVAADVAWVHSALFPDGATKYADLCARRSLLNDQIKAFHQAVQAGNVSVVRSMLEQAPALRRSRMNDDATALMASALAPNSIDLLQCLLDGSFTNEATVKALVYACQHGAAAVSINHLWNWVESFDRDDVRRACALWEAIMGAAVYEQFAALRTMLAYVRDWTHCQARDFFICVVDSNDDEFSCGILALPAVEAYFKTLDDSGNGSIASMDVEGYADACDRSHVGSCSEVAFCRVPTAQYWVRRALSWGSRRVVDCLEKWWPAMTRKAAFLQCYRDATARCVAREVSQRYVRGVTWGHTRDAYLVQRRVLPGLYYLGRHVATYLYVYDVHNEYNRIRKSRDSIFFLR